MSEWMVVRRAVEVTGTKNEDLRDLNEPIGDGPDGYKIIYPYSKNLLLEPYPRASDMAYEIEDVDQFHINFSVPYVPWQHFEHSMAYQAGLTYSDYISCMTDRLGSSYRWNDHRAKFCANTAGVGFGRPYWRVPVSAWSSVVSASYDTCHENCCCTFCTEDDIDWDNFSQII
jgi:hypothetical protein